MQAVFPKECVVLVSGASGFTGSKLLPMLAAQGVRLRAIARASSDISKFSALPIEWIRGEIFDPAVIDAAMQGVEYVFHLAAAYRQAGISDTTYTQVHVESTKLIAARALRNSNFKRLVHVSTVGVHGHIENPPADENYPFGPGDQYQRTKAEAELWLHKFAAENKLPYTVIRPAAIYGPEDRRLLKLFKMAAWPIVPILGFGKCLYHLIHVNDLCRALILAALHPNAQGEAFIVGDAEPQSLPNILKSVAEVLGTRPRILRVPSFPAFILADLCEAICKPLGIEPPLYRRRVAFFTKDRCFNTAKLRDLLGFQYGATPQQGLKDTARWYVEHSWLKSSTQPQAGKHGYKEAH